MKRKERWQKLTSLDMPGLENELKTLAENRFRLRLKHAEGELSKNHEFKVIRRDIARIRTLITQKNSAAN
ncbi:MAG: 50S ribosomal protein L29 [Pseudomonadota bacterium]